MLKRNMMHLYIKRMLVAVLFVIAKKKKQITKKSPSPPTKILKHKERGKNTNIHQKQNNKLWYVYTKELYIAMTINKLQ